MTKTTPSSSMPLGILIGAVLAILAFSIPSIFPSLGGQFPSPSQILSKLYPNSGTVASSSDSAVFHTTTTAAESQESSPPPSPFVCEPHPYSISIISLSPLVIYLSSFLSDVEISSLLSTGDPLFKPSNVQRSGADQVYTSRTSTSALLPGDDPAVTCVLARAKDLMGTFHSPGRDDMGSAQLVRYVEGQKFDVHHDWFDSPQISPRSDPLKRPWNRAVSFFAILEDDCEEGETWFPHVTPIEPQPPVPDGVLDRMPREVWPGWRHHPDGGVAFRPIRGNAVFWVNLHQNGTGDMRTVHAGLPVKGGRKTAMNIWPKKYFV